MTMTTSPASPYLPAVPADAYPVGGHGRPACLPLPLGLPPAVEGVVHHQPADRPVVLGDWPAHRVGFGAAGVVVGQAAVRRDVKGAAYRRPLAPPRSALACALVVMPVAAMCLSWQ